LPTPHSSSDQPQQQAHGTAPTRRRITVINDNPEFLAMMQDLLDADGYDVSVIDGDNISSVEPIREQQPELLIVDLLLRGTELSGWDIALAVRADEELRALPMVVCSADVHQVRERAEELTAMPGVEVILKPFKLAEMEALLQRMLP